MSLRAAARRLASVLLAAGLIPSLSALAVTKPAPGFHCVNGKGVQVKGAYTQQDCHPPYKWTVASAPATPKKAVAAAAAAKKAKPKLAQAGGKKKAHKKKTSR